MRFKGKAIALVMAGVLLFAACDENQGGKAVKADAKTVANQLTQYQQSQPVPAFNRSQLRQNLIEIETAQVKSTATTSFMFLLAGVGETGPMIHSCPSIGFPIPATYQLTAPEGPVNTPHHDDVVLPQLESNGVYTGDTTGTYVMCVGADGKPFAFYHEGYVSTVTGPAHWDSTKGEIVMDGTSSAEFTVQK